MLVLPVQGDADAWRHSNEAVMSVSRIEPPRAYASGAGAILLSSTGESRYRAFELTRCRSASKIAMNSAPMIFRFFSGSVTPASFVR